MAEKTARERFDGAVAELKALESDGYDCGPVKRLSLSATARAVEAPKVEPKPPALSQDKPEEKKKPFLKS